MNKNSKLIVALLIVVIVLLISIILGIYFIFLRKIPVTQITLKESNISLYLDDAYNFKYTILPQNATDKETVIKSYNENIAKVENDIITATGKGTTKVCVTSKSNNKIKSCVDITVSSKRDEFIKHMNEFVLYKKIDDCSYNTNDGVVNVCDNTFTINSNSDGITIQHVYHYGQDYIDGFSTDNNFLIKYYYDTKTNILSCVGNTPLYHQTMCNESSNNVTKNLFNTMVQRMESIAGDFKLKDIV